MILRNDNSSDLRVQIECLPCRLIILFVRLFWWRLSFKEHDLIDLLNRRPPVALAVGGNVTLSKGPMN